MGAPTDSVYYIKTDSTQFKVMPIKISVLLDQTRIPEFLIALENSPMAIEVRDFEMSKPTTPRREARQRSDGQLRLRRRIHGRHGRP